MMVPLLWRNRDYLLLWSGQTVSAVGSQVSGFVLPLLVLVLTGSPAQAGLVGAVAGLPYVVFSLPAGALVDRWNRKRLMIACDVGRALNMVSVPLAIALGRLSVGQLYIVAAVEGTLFVFFNLAETAALPRLVPRERMPDAMAQSEITWGVSALAGPPLGGALFAVASHALPFLADAVSYGASVFSLLTIRTRFEEERVGAGDTGPRGYPGLQAVREALCWLRDQHLFRFVAMLSAAGDFLFAGIALLPMVVARQQMRAGPLAIGFIFTFAAVGGIVGSLLATRVQRQLRFGRTVIGTSWLLVALYPLLALAPNPLALGVVRSLLSGTVAVSNTARLSYQISAIPDALQGRVNSLTSLAAYGSLPLGEALTGLALQAIGKTPTILATTGLLAVLALAASLNERLRSAR